MVDTADPVLTVDQPAAGIVTESKVMLRGRVVDVSKCRVEVDGVVLEVAEDGTFERELQLASGDVTVVLVATDAVGRRAEVRHTLKVDADSPRLTNIEYDKVTRNDFQPLSGEVAGLDGGSLTLDGKPVVLAGGGRFTDRVKLPQDGQYTFVLLATDRRGRRSEWPIVVRRDTVAPDLEWLVPEAGKPVLGGEVTLHGLVRDASGSAVVRVNGKVAVVEGDRWTATVVVPYGEEISVVVSAVDEAGNVRPDERRTIQGLGPFADRIGADFRAVVSAGTGEAGLPKRLLHEPTQMEFVLIPSGTFSMGSPTDEAARSDDEVQHKVTLSMPFYLAETEVSVAVWRRFAEERKYRTEAETNGKGGYSGRFDAAGKWEWVPIAEAIWSNPLPYFTAKWQFTLDDHHPVTQVSWNDAMEFVGHYRLHLPTEAQWEYACRAAAATRYWWGRTDVEGKGLINAGDRSSGRPLSWDDAFPFDDGYPFYARVNRYVLPNAFGLKDMAGNVWEWCADWADTKDDNVVTDTYRDGVADPLSLHGAQRVRRGGGWFTVPAYCRSACRDALDPSSAYGCVGFRPALVAKPLAK